MLADKVSDIVYREFKIQLHSDLHSNLNSLYSHPSLGLPSLLKLTNWALYQELLKVAPMVYASEF